MTYCHTGTTSWTDVTPSNRTSLKEGVEIVAAAANSGTCLYDDGSSQPSASTTGFEVRLDNPMGVFIPKSVLQESGNLSNKIWVKLSSSSDKLYVRGY